MFSDLKQADLFVAFFILFSILLILVSQDVNILEIMQKHDVDVVISASTLKCLADNSDPKRRWMIPVVVKNIDIPKGNYFINVIYI